MTLQITLWFINSNPVLLGNAFHFSFHFRSSWAVLETGLNQSCHFFWIGYTNDGSSICQNLNWVYVLYEAAESCKVHIYFPVQNTFSGDIKQIKLIIVLLRRANIKKINYLVWKSTKFIIPNPSVIKLDPFRECRHNVLYILTKGRRY